MGVVVEPVGETRRLRWARMADRIEALARREKCLGKYRELISHLRRGVIGERCEERAEAALDKLKF